MEKEILNNPNSTRADIVNICFACGEKAIELGLTCTLDEVERELELREEEINIAAEAIAKVAIYNITEQGDEPTEFERRLAAQECKKLLEALDD